MSNKHEELEKKLDEQTRELNSLKKAVGKIERDEEIKRVVKDQQGGLLKYFVDLFKIILAIIIIATGSKMSDQPWITDLIK
jgi:hypothetical protein